ncbi:LacI family DNA-binding transcriptional regulator [Thermanaerothrix sp.]|uniref:LacI family DNA-binding transcriptional regulator n=1 Tax=Thermanaerothrix sp. TaxID=2972675 RepID=UPI003C7C23CF
MATRKRVTAQDVARLAGVSRTTVSFVLNNVTDMRISEETRQKVLAAARLLNYHPDAVARRMVTGRTRVVGFVLRQSPEQAFADLFLPQVLNGLSQAAARQGYQVLFEPIPPDQPNTMYSRLVNERHVDGIILSGPRFDDEDLLRLHREGAPLVLIGRLPDVEIPYVDVDNIGGARMATEYLIQKGHRRIGLITNAPLSYTASAERLSGYRQALEAAGLAFDETLVRYGNFTPHSGYQAMAALLQVRPLPTAVFVASDTVALGALQAIRHAGLRIPSDISLIGFDDIPLAGFLDPPLTTIHLPAFNLGWEAAEMLLQRLSAEEATPPYRLLATHLVERESCAPPRKS